VIHYLTLEQLIDLAALATGRRAEVRELGLLDSAAARPRTSVFGADAYPDLFTKAGALLHSIVRNHPLVDGNKRLGWLACYVFCEINGAILDPDEDEAYDFVIAVASGELDEVDKIAEVLRRFAGQEGAHESSGPFTRSDDL
jgi:death-on-curing protein